MAVLVILQEEVQVQEQLKITREESSFYQFE